LKGVGKEMCNDMCIRVFSYIRMIIVVPVMILGYDDDDGGVRVSLC
jgi:hypothetical protein